MRHYGALQGLNKSEMAENMVKTSFDLRRSYDVRPPALEKMINDILDLIHVTKI